MGTALLIDILIHTDYTIKGKNLHIRSGILFYITLPICKISRISGKSTILSSPALSLKRIRITYGRNNIVYISPQKQENFIKDLLLINPNIIVEE
ncbi:MAG: PH domain-containing protein [Muribaculaceae bacterium]